MKRQFGQTVRAGSQVCVLILFAGLAGFGVSPLNAAVYYWDPNGAAAGLYGSGDWNTSDSTWRTPGSTDPLTPWVNGNTAYLLGGSTLNLTENISMLGSYNQSWGTDITFNTTNGSSLTLAGTSWMNHYGGARAVYNCPVILAANFTPSGTGPMIFNQAITGAYLVVMGTGNDFTFNAANDYKYTYFGDYGTTVSIGHNGAFGPYAGGTPTSGANDSLWFSGGASAIHAFQAVGGARTVNNGLWMNGSPLQLNLTGSNTLEFSGNMVTPVAASILILNSSNTADTVFSGIISRGCSLVKAGSGRLILSGTNIYSGATTVSNGTLLVNGTTMGQGDYTVVAAAMLGGTGTLRLASGKALTVNGTLAPRSASGAPGTLSVTGAVTLAENSGFVWTYESGTGSLLSASGALTLPSVATVSVSRVSGTLPKTAVIGAAGSLAGAGDLSAWVVTGAHAGAYATVNGTTVMLKGLTPSAGTVLSIK